MIIQEIREVDFMYCLKCGKEIDEGINYCPNCGMNLSVKTDVQLTLQKQTSGKNIAALVLGLVYLRGSFQL